MSHGTKWLYSFRKYDMGPKKTPNLSLVTLYLERWEMGKKRVALEGTWVGDE